MSLLLLSVSESDAELVASTNAVIKASQTKTASTSGAISDHNSQVTTTNAVIQAHQTVTTATNATLQVPAIRTASTNALIADHYTLTASTSAVIQARFTVTFGSRAVIQAHQTKTSSTNAIIWPPHVQVTTNAVIQAHLTKTASTNARIIDAQKVTTNAVIKALQTKTASTNARIIGPVISNVVNAVIQAHLSRTATANAVIKALQTKTASTNAAIQGNFQQTSTNVVIRFVGVPLPVATNAVFITPGTLPVGTNAIIAGGQASRAARAQLLGSAFMQLMSNQPPTPQQFATLFSKAYEQYAQTVIPTPILAGRRQLMEKGLLAAFNNPSGSKTSATNGLLNGFSAFWVGTPLPGGIVTAFLGREVMKAQLMATFKGPSTSQAELASKLAKILVSSTHLVQYVVGISPPAFLA